ncbi:exonuclease SbcCD subunit D [Vibrio sp. WJH972]
MKFIHTSDWHLGRSFHNRSLIDDQAYILRQLTRYLGEHSDIDALLIAGDIYDRSVPPTVAIELLEQVIDQVCQKLNVPIILIPGNHDSAVRLGFAASHMSGSGLHILSDIKSITTPVILEDNKGQQVAFYGIPYVDPEFIRNDFSVQIKTHDEMYQFLIGEITRDINSNIPNVLLAHCFVDGADESDSERPLSLGGLDKVRPSQFEAFDYVALGHLHQPQKRIKESIRYSGSLLKYSFSEHQQNKSMTIVELNEDGEFSTTPLKFSPMRDVRVIEGELSAIIESASRDAHSEDYLLVRLLDKHAMLDPMEKLRTVYHNVLHIEKPGLMREGSDMPSSSQLKRGELDMFGDFFQEIQGEALTDSQLEVIKQTLGEINQGEGE